MNLKNNDDHSLKPMSLKELRDLYGVSYKTLRTWLAPFLQEIGEHKSRLFTIKQVRIIFKRLGAPEGFDFEE